MSDTPVRSLAKAVSWRITGTVDTFIIAWLITGQPLIASGIAFTEIMTKICLFWLHERVWNRISWGRQTQLTESKPEPILPGFVLPSRQNQTWKVSGTDDPTRCLDVEHFNSFPYPVVYHYNSRGFRDQEWPNDTELSRCIWCVGDSFTVGVGSPLEHTWPYILGTKTQQRVINVSMDGASNNWISRKVTELISTIQPKVVVVQWSYIERREDVTNKIFNKVWYDLYETIKEPHWPDCPDINKFSTLPMEIQQEIMTHHADYWRHGITDEELRLGLVPCTEQEDIKNTVECLTQADVIARRHGTRLIHSFVPRFMNKKYQGDFFNTLRQLNIDTIGEVNQVDFARDRHHYDLQTARAFVDQLLTAMAPSATD